MRQVVLQGEGALEIGNRLQVLEILGRSPEEKSAGDVSLGKIRITLESAPAMEFGFLEPHAGWVEFEMPGGAGERESRMSQGKRRIASDGIGEVMAGLIHHGTVAG